MTKKKPSVCVQYISKKLAIHTHTHTHITHTSHTQRTHSTAVLILNSIFFLEDAVAEGIEGIKDIMADRNVDGGEFQHLAAMLEQQFTELTELCKKFPLGDEYYVTLLTENLLQPVSEVLNAEYRTVRVAQQEKYVTLQQECEQLAKDRDDLWTAGVVCVP